MLDIPIDDDGAAEIGRRARGTPRIANRLLRRVRDFAEVRGDGKITLDAAQYALGRLEVDALGLDAGDRRILSTIIQRFDGGPVGVESLAAALAEDRDTLEYVYEPYLIQEGFLLRTPRGRPGHAPRLRAPRCPPSRRAARSGAGDAVLAFPGEHLGPNIPAFMSWTVPNLGPQATSDRLTLLRG